MQVYGRGKMPLDAPASEYEPLGLTVALHMRLMWFGQYLFSLLTLVALAMIVFNMTGTYLRDGDNNSSLVGWAYYSHTLGNAPDLIWLHALTACVTCAVLCAAIGWEQINLRAVQRRVLNSATTAHYSVLVSGLPSDPEAADAAVTELTGSQQVVQRVVVLDNRKLVLALRAHARATREPTRASA